MTRPLSDKLNLCDLNDDFLTYFDWSANALMPVNPGEADRLLKVNRSVILQVAQHLLKRIDYVPGPIYRGIILKHPVEVIVPHWKMQYLSFSTDRRVAAHFADVNGFGSAIMNVAARLGTYGYIAEYTPEFREVLFHHALLSYLPYAQRFSFLGMNGEMEVEGLKRQQEVIILQPAEPLINLTAVRK